MRVLGNERLRPTRAPCFGSTDRTSPAASSLDAAAERLMRICDQSIRNLQFRRSPVSPKLRINGSRSKAGDTGDMFGLNHA